MKVYQLNRKQKIDRPIDEVWEFFSSPNNLRKITPADMDFNVRSELPDEMYPGMIIEYQVRPIASIPVTWVTEITQLQPPHFFIDEQRIGPYSFWHHQHHFRSLGIKGGTEIVDLVHYSVPLGILGRFAHWLFIDKQLNAIFDYRNEVIGQLFPKVTAVTE